MLTTTIYKSYREYLIILILLTTIISSVFIVKESNEF